MAEEKLITVREVSALLGIAEKEVIELSESGAIPAYKIGGVYLRFKRSQVEEYRKKQSSRFGKITQGKKYSFAEKMRDFLYYNDFYVLAAILIILILIIIFRE